MGGIYHVPAARECACSWRWCSQMPNPIRHLTCYTLDREEFRQRERNGLVADSSAR
jgi:hypothetical protein